MSAFSFSHLLADSASDVSCQAPGYRPRALLSLLARGGKAMPLWQADQLADGGAAQDHAVCATGFVALDAQLPGRGWPLGQLIELLQPRGASLAWSLLLPALQHLVAPRRTVLLVGAPHIGAGALQPYGPALAARGLSMSQVLWVHGGDAATCLWAIEQALRCPAVAAVVAWLPHDPRVGVTALRRLQLAAAQGRQALFVLRPEAQAQASSPAPLRLHLGHAPDPMQLQLHILKRRGPPLAGPLLVPAQPDALVQVLVASRWRTQARAHESAASEPIRTAAHGGLQPMAGRAWRAFRPLPA